jgi:uncharacterized repeat protein (TIGR01451 family)
MSRLRSARGGRKPRSSVWPYRRPLAVERLEDRWVPTIMLRYSTDGGVTFSAPVSDGGTGTVSATISGTDLLIGANANGLNTPGLGVLNLSVGGNAPAAPLDLIVQASETGLTAAPPPQTLTYAFSGSILPSGGSAAEETWVDNNNVAFETTGGGIVGDTGAQPIDLVGHTTNSGSVVVTGAVPYAVTTQLHTVFTGPASISFNDQNVIAPSQTTPPTPDIQIVKLTNGTNNDTPPTAGTPDGPIIVVGGPVNWTYFVTATNSGEPIKDVVVTDDNGTPGNPADDFHPAPVLGGDGFNVGDTHDKGFLDPDETWQYSASSTAQLGQYSNIASVTGTGTVSNTPVGPRTNPDHYFGVDAFISITPAHPYNEVGHAETFTVTVTALPDTSQLAAANVSFATPTITYPGMTPDLSAPTTATFVSRSGNVATYSVTVNSDQTGTFEVKASDAITFSSPASPNTAQNPNPLTLTRATGDGYVVPGNLGSDSPDAFKTWVDAYIKIQPSATNPVNAPHTFTVQVFADTGDGTGFHQVQDTEPVTETLTAGNGASITQINPGNGTGLASATYSLTTITAFNPGVTFTSPTAGTVTGHAAADLVVGGVSLHRETNGVGNNSGDAVKTFVSGSPNLVVTKTADQATVTAGQTIGFTVTITNTGGADATGVKLTDQLPPGGGGDIFWSVDTSNTGLGAGTNPSAFTISGPKGSQVLTLTGQPITLAAGAALKVHITSPTNANDVSGGAVGVQSGVNPVAYLGAASDYGVLYMLTSGVHTLQITNVTIGANVGVGKSVGGSGAPKVSFGGPGAITGRLDFEAANTGQFSNNNGSNVGPASVNYNVATVTSAISTVTNLSSSLAGLGTPLAINGNQTINESAGQLTTVGGVTYRIFNITSYSENDGKLVTINGDGSGNPVVFNFSFNSNVNLGGDVALTGNGLSDDKVIWNFTSAGKNISLNNNASSYPNLAFHGIILAPQDAISLVNANLSGRIFGGNSSDMQIVSGDTLHAPVLNTATVTASNVTFDANDTASAAITITGISFKQKALPQLAAGATNIAGVGFTELLGTTVAIQNGTIDVAVDLPAGPQAPAEQAAITAAIATLNSEVGSLGIHFRQVFGADADAAQVHIRISSTSDIGGVDEGVLGAFSAGEITLVDGWNWYFGSDADGIAADQYDFQTVMAHELGHALGLGENADPSSAMSLYLAPGAVRRDLTAVDLDAIRQLLPADAATLPAAPIAVGPGTAAPPAEAPWWARINLALPAADRTGALPGPDHAETFNRGAPGARAVLAADGQNWLDAHPAAGLPGDDMMVWVGKPSSLVVDAADGGAGLPSFSTDDRLSAYDW